MIRKLSLYESTKLDCKADNFIRPDFTVEFRKKRLAVACAIAEKENKFMVSFKLIVKNSKLDLVPGLLDIIRQLTRVIPSFTKTAY